MNSESGDPVVGRSADDAPLENDTREAARRKGKTAMRVGLIVKFLWKLKDAVVVNGEGLY